MKIKIVIFKCFLTWKTNIHAFPCFWEHSEDCEVSKLDVKHIHHGQAQFFRYDIDGSVLSHVKEEYGISS